MRLSPVLAAFNRLSVWRGRIRVWDFVMQAPTFDRWLYLLLHRLNWMGRDERAILPHLVQPGMHVADVGSNLGLYTLEISRLAGSAGRVYAFEPDPLMFDALCDNIAANHAGNVELFACAIGAEPGQLVLNRSSFNSGDNRIGTAAGTALHSDRVSVPVQPLHEVLAGRRVDLIKMDVQGWEVHSLRGIGPLFEANADLQVYFEFWPHGLNLAGTSIQDLDRLLHNYKLSLYSVDREGATRSIQLAEVARALPGQAYANLLARRN